MELSKTCFGACAHLHDTLTATIGTLRYHIWGGEERERERERVLKQQPSLLEVVVLTNNILNIVIFVMLFHDEKYYSNTFLVQRVTRKGQSGFG
jgi:hypothetical protein